MQELDTRIDGLHHQLKSIPEAAALAELATRRGDLDGTVRDLRVQVSDLTEEQGRADADVEQVRTRRVRDQAMIDSGAVGDPKALERMLGELESLQRRIASLEDTEIEVMERLEAAEAALQQKTVELEGLDAEVSRLETARAGSAARLEADLADVLAERKTTASGVPEDLMALYEKLRAQKGGVGAAALRRRECGGCGLAINASDLDVIRSKPTDEVVRCEECNRILIRTGESGL